MSSDAIASHEGSPERDKGVSGLDGPVSRHLNRPISRRISAHVADNGMTPDQWSWVAFGTVCGGAAAFAARAPRLGGLLVHAGSVLDGVDGEVARHQGTSSAGGALLDLVLDRVSDIIVLAGLAQASGGRRTHWLLALAAANGVLVSGLAKERLGAEQQSVSDLQREESAGNAIDRVLPWTNRDGRLLAVTLGGLLRTPWIPLTWIAVSSNVRLVRRFVSARAMLDRPRP
jgi:CDP-L-myo-inositol myo-inositolphosphotransferase